MVRKGWLTDGVGEPPWKSKAPTALEARLTSSAHENCAGKPSRGGGSDDARTVPGSLGGNGDDAPAIGE